MERNIRKTETSDQKDLPREIREKKSKRIEKRIKRKINSRNRMRVTAAPVVFSALEKNLLPPPLLFVFFPLSAPCAVQSLHEKLLFTANHYDFGFQRKKRRGAIIYLSPLCVTEKRARRKKDERQPHTRTEREKK